MANNKNTVIAIFIILIIIGFSAFAYDQFYIIPSYQSQLSSVDSSLAAEAQSLQTLNAQMLKINSTLAATSSGIISLNSSIISENSHLQSMAEQLIEAPRVGIISSEATVTRYYVPYMSDVTSLNISGYTFYLGIMNGTPVVVTESLPREAGTAQTTTIMDTNFNLIANIFTGIAGSRNSNVYVGDVVVAAFTVNKAAVHYHRDYIGPYSIPIGLANGSFVDSDYLASSYGLVALASSYNNLGTTSISIVTGNQSATGSMQAKILVGVDGSANQWTESLGWMEFQNALYQTDAGENNAYGFASVNEAYGIPSLVLQGISDSPWYPNAYDGSLAQQRVASVARYVITNFGTVSMNSLRSTASFNLLSPLSNARLNGYIVANQVFTKNISSSISVTKIIYTAQNGSMVTLSNMSQLNGEYIYPIQMP